MLCVDMIGPCTVDPITDIICVAQRLSRLCMHGLWAGL